MQARSSCAQGITALQAWAKLCMQPRVTGEWSECVKPLAGRLLTLESWCAGNTMCSSDAVRKIGFTGSTRVGKLLFSQAAETMKKVSFSDRQAFALEEQRAWLNMFLPVIECIKQGLAIKPDTQSCHHTRNADCPGCRQVSMELGGNAPFIVFDDADVESAAANVVASGLRNAGQTCICANRVFCQASRLSGHLACSTTSRLPVCSCLTGSPAR